MPLGFLSTKTGFVTSQDECKFNTNLNVMDEPLDRIDFF